MKKILFWILLLSFTPIVYAQESANFKIEQGTFNSGGNPSPELTSTSYKMTLDSIGEGIAASGLSSASNKMDSGLPSDYRPPGEVMTLLFSDATTLTWTPEPSVGSYNLYRGDVTGLPGSYGTKVQSGIADPTTTDSQVPGPGQCLIFIVTASNRLGEEGTKGN